MTSNPKKNRVIFLDLIRAFAVLMMVQGHTVDVFLGDTFRDMNSYFYLIWLSNRGMTAPIFMFTAGTTFAYLFRLHREPFIGNPRVMKGVRRFLLLLSLGYLLRYPTPWLIDFSHVRAYEWMNFFAVDVLQLIGFGVFSVLLLLWLAELLRVSDTWVFGFFALAAIAVYPFMESVNWKAVVHPALAGYLYKGTGSNFPLFPWLAYLYAGCILGSYLAKHGDVFRTKSFSLRLFLFSLALFAASGIGNLVELASTGTSHFWTTSPNLVFYRLAFVLLLNAAFTLAAMRITTIPRVVILLGRNTLLIYVVHVALLYGTTWSLGLAAVWSKTLSPWLSLGAAALMIGLMTGLVILLDRLNIKNKPLVAS